MDREPASSARAGPVWPLSWVGYRIALDRLEGARQMGRLAGGVLGPAPAGAARLALLGRCDQRLETVIRNRIAAQIRQADLTGAGLPDAGSDLCVVAFPGEADPVALARSIARVLRPGGAFVILETQSVDLSQPQLRGAGLTASHQTHLLRRLHSLAGVRPIASGDQAD